MSHHSTNHRYALCVSKQGDELSVLRGKVYRMLSPEPNDPASMIRIVDEEGEDYLYPREWFIAVDLPQAAIAALEAA